MIPLLVFFLPIYVVIERVFNTQQTLLPPGGKLEKKSGREEL